MLLRNDLLHYQQPSPRTIRILWIDPGQSHAYVYDVSARSAEVEPVQLAALHADLRAGHAIVLENDPYLMLVCQELLPPKYLQLRARAWEIIAPLVAQEPDIYDARLRGQMIARATISQQVSHPTIYRYLRRYWQRGQTPNALLPDYSNSGGKGKVRQSSAGIKRGRPRKNGAGDGPGLNADEEIRRIFRVAVARYDAAHARFSRLGAYQQMLGEFFIERRIDPDTGRVQAMPARSTSMMPTFGQFNYWLDHDDDRPPEAARRHAGGAAPAAMQSPLPLISAMNAPAGRPGASYYLQAVCADVQLVSRVDREQAIGRPCIYVVTDSFSRMVTGIHIGLGTPGWEQAMLALAHCSADKQRYSLQYGRHIDATQWPCRHLPDMLYLQGALAGGWNGETLLNNFNLRCVAADSGPDDWKTVLARRFRLLSADQEGATSRLDGVLDIAQFTRIVIDCILYYNNRHPQPLAASSASTSAARLWDWGVLHRSGALKTYPEHLVHCSLMPVASAMVDGAGIHFAGGVYACSLAEQERWHERARQRGAWQVRVAYDPSNLDTVYLLDVAAPMLFQACQLADSDSARRGLCSAERAHLPLANPLAWVGATSSSSHHGAPVIA
ncbi:MAG: Mu transposase C-terminal domain-containing protein [Duganella sp.]